MFLEKIILKNVKKHKFLEIDFKNQSCLILGQNGSGKSTIIESIVFALYRETLVPNISYMINDDIKTEKGYLDSAYVDLYLNSDNKKYFIRSGLAKSDTFIKVLENNEYKLLSNKVNEVVSFIKSDILKNINFEYFMETIYCEQMGLLSLFSKSPSIRQNTFDKILGLEQFQKIYAGLNILSNTLEKSAGSFDINALELEKKDLEDKIEKNKIEIAKNEEKIKEIDNKNLELKEQKTLLNKTLIEKEKTHCYLSNQIRLIKNNQLELIKYTASLEEDMKKLESLEKENLKDEENAFKILLDEIKEKFSKLNLKLSEFYNYISYEKKRLQEEKDRLLEKQYKIKEWKDITNKINQIEIELPKKENNLKTYQDNLFQNQNIEKELSKTLDELNSALNKEKEDLMNITSHLNVFYKKYEKNIYFAELNLKNLNSLDECENFFKKNLDKEIECPTCFSKTNFKHIIEIFKQDFSEVLKKKENLETIKNTIKDLEIKIENLKTQITKKREENKKLEKEILVLTASIENLKNELKILNSKLDNAEKASEEEITEKLKNLNSELDNLSDNKIQKIFHFITPSKIQNDAERVKHNPDELISEIEKYQELLEKAKNLDFTIKQHKNEIEKYITSIKTKKEKIAHFENTNKSIFEELKVSNVEELENRILELNKEIQNVIISTNRINEEIKYLNETYNLITNQNNNILNFQNEYINRKNEIEKILTKDKELKEKLNDVLIVKSYFKQDGVSKDIRNYFINMLNKNLRNYITHFSFDFIPQLDETLNIENFHKLSGGQKISVAILIRILLNFILKNPIKLFILDEPTAYLDEIRIDSLREILNTIKDKAQVFVITHEKDLYNLDYNLINI